MFFLSPSVSLLVIVLLLVVAKRLSVTVRIRKLKWAGAKGLSVTVRVRVLKWAGAKRLLSVLLTVSEEQWEQLTQERDEAMAMMETRHRCTTEKMRTELESRNSREQEVNIMNRLESCYLAIAATFNRLAK